MCLLAQVPEFVNVTISEECIAKTPVASLCESINRRAKRINYSLMNKVIYKCIIAVSITLNFDLTCFVCLAQMYFPIIIHMPTFSFMMPEVHILGYLRIDIIQVLCLERLKAKPRDICVI